MTVATVAYYSGVHPYTLRPINTAKTEKEKRNQHQFFFWHKAENKDSIKHKLLRADRKDLAIKLLGENFVEGKSGRRDEQGKKEVPKWLQERRNKDKKKSNFKKKRRR